MTSEAKRKRKHKVRNGKLDPTIKRGSWNGVNPVTKSTPTKKGLLEKIERKEEQQWKVNRLTIQR